MKRFEEGYVCSRNPLFPNKVTRYDITPGKVDAIQFCSKNYEPILADLPKITDRFPTYFHYTDSPLLLGHLKETDTVQQGAQASFLAKDAVFGQQTLE